jgi:hypothetical protein
MTTERYQCAVPSCGARTDGGLFCEKHRGGPPQSSPRASHCHPAAIFAADSEP